MVCVLFGDSYISLLFPYMLLSMAAELNRCRTLINTNGEGSIVDQRPIDQPLVLGHLSLSIYIHLPSFILHLFSSSFSLRRCCFSYSLSILHRLQEIFRSSHSFHFSVNQVGKHFFFLPKLQSQRFYLSGFFFGSTALCSSFIGSLHDDRGLFFLKVTSSR